LAAIALGLGISIYRYRLQQITRALEIRFDERIRERTRIARDLHDSLLQGFTGLTLRFHALAYSLAADNPIRTRIEGNLRHARELMEETRTRVRDLRSQDEPQASLEELLREFIDTLTRSASTKFELRVVGVTKRVDSMASEEILLVGREAISNAMTHAAATRVEVELTYSARNLTLRVSDDGKGMDAQTLEAGREGHWGLQGMRERAQSLGASLELWSRPGEGTDIQLVVPGAIAYPDSRSKSAATPMKRLLRLFIGGPGAW
jgi:signal transduction histidine kinase